MALFGRATTKIFFFQNNCYSKLPTNSVKLKFYNKYSAKILSISRNWSNIRFSHSEPINNSHNGSYITYDNLILKRKSEALRSVLIQVQSEKSCPDIYNYCSTFGKIKEVFHYTTQQMERHFVLIEFENEESIKSILNEATHINHDHIVPVQSTLLWFRNAKNGKISNQNGSNVNILKNCCKIPSNMEVYKSLLTANSLSEQIKLVYDITKLNEAGTRLRFLTSNQIEKSFSGLFPKMSVTPFGSSVNGFGKQGCDLDLLTDLQNNKKENLTSRLIFQTKSMSSHEKEHFKQFMECIADTMIFFMPGISNVRKILEARVPIIKFDHIIAGIECDLSMTNMTAYYMSELLYMYGELDWRLRPLTFTVKKWAQSMKLTNKSPGPWITNFSLSLMVIFFLQQKKILPSLNTLKSYAKKEDVRVADLCIDCTFIRDISQIKRNENSDSLETLLLEFFEYYGNFDFESQAISIREGKTVPKPEYSALYIYNPLETLLNVSKNVRYEELERIKVALRSASWHLEVTDKNSESWGLLSIFIDKNSKEFSYLRSSNKSIDFQSLFEKDNKETKEFKKRRNEAKVKLDELLKTVSM